MFLRCWIRYDRLKLCYWLITKTQNRFQIRLEARKNPLGMISAVYSGDFRNTKITVIMVIWWFIPDLWTYSSKNAKTWHSNYVPNLQSRIQYLFVLASPNMPWRLVLRSPSHSSDINYAFTRHKSGQNYHLHKFSLMIDL